MKLTRTTDTAGLHLGYTGRGRLFTGLLAALLASAAASSAIGQVLWSGNGHYYLVVNQEATWQQARLLAESMEFMGVQGHLATITSEAENTFVSTQLGDTATAWLGGEQPPGSAEPAGGWRWITGEPWVYTNWNEGEPNNSYGGDFGNPTSGLSEERLHYLFDGTHWNDLPDDPEVVTPLFIVEWDVKGAEDVGGTVTGLQPALIVCENLTTEQVVVIWEQAPSWNCETAGLEVAPDDIIRITLVGGAQ